MSNTSKERFLHISRFLIAFGVFILSAFLFGLIGSKVIELIFGVSGFDITSLPAADFTHNDRIALKLYQAISASSFIFSAFVITKVYRVSFAEFTGLSNRPNPRLILLSICLFIALIPIVNAMVVFNGNLALPDSIEQSFKEWELRSDNLYEAILDLNTGTFLLFNLVLMAVIPAIGEELIFRGIIMRVFASWFKNIHMGVVLSALLFALLHFQPYKFIPMVFIALTLGYIYVLTGSLWVSIGVHFINNSLVVISDYLVKVGVQHPWLREDYEFSQTVLLTSVLLFSGLFYVLTKKSKPIVIE